MSERRDAEDEVCQLPGKICLVAMRSCRREMGDRARDESDRDGKREDAQTGRECCLAPALALRLHGLVGNR